MGDNTRKYRDLARNIGVLTIGSFATKVLVFFLVPLYTNILSTTEYGIYDLYATILSILIPILTLNIQEAVMRFALDGVHERNTILAIGIRYLVWGTLITAAALVVNDICGFSALLKAYTVYFLLGFIMQALSGMMIAYIRGVGRIADLSVSTIVNALGVIVCNILFLVVFKLGLAGYFMANIIGPLIQCVYLMIRARVGVSVRPVDAALKADMLAYSKPLIPDTIAWWLNRIADKYVIICFIGIAESGVYSIAAKIPAILNAFQHIFNQVWTLSVVREYDPEDRSGFFSQTYATYNCFMVAGCSALIIADKPLARFLFAKDFYAAWRYVPWLLIAIVFGSLSGYLSGFFSAVKNSALCAKSTVRGALCNILLNVALTPFIGAMGTAIATAAGYVVIWLLRFAYSRKYIRLRVKMARDVVSYLILILQTVVLIVLDGLMVYCIEILLFAIIIALYRDEVIALLKTIVSAVIGKTAGKRETI